MWLQSSSDAALIVSDRLVSYDELRRRIVSLASAFSLSKGGRAAIFCENREEWVHALYAVWLQGGTVVPIDSAASCEEVVYILDDCRPELVFHSAQTAAVLHAAADRAVHRPTLFDLETAPAQSTPAVPPEFTFPAECTALILYTSGTTGSPKGVMLSFDNIQANIESVSKGVPIFLPGERTMVLLPLHHIFPLVGSLVAPLYTGGVSVFCPGLSAPEILATLQNHRITIIIGVPRLYQQLVKGIQQKIQSRLAARVVYRLASLFRSLRLSRILFREVQQRFGGHIKYLVSGGSALDPAVGRVLHTLGFEVLEGFGMTEAAPMITFTRPGDVRIGSTGLVVPGHEIRLVDGEVTVRGRHVMQGYYNRPAETAEVVRDGWLHTGDLGRFDRRGRLYITGRIKEIIVTTGGKNINPEEIEKKLLTICPCLREAGVFLADQVLQAVLVFDEARSHTLSDGKSYDVLAHETLDRFNHSVAPYKRLLKYHIAREELPKTRLGKLRRYLLPQAAGAADRPRPDVPAPTYPEYRTLADFLERQAERPVRPDDHLEFDLGLDSLDKVSLQVFIQGTFGVSLSEMELLAQPTVAGLANQLRERGVKLEVEAVDWKHILQETTHMKLPRSGVTQVLIRFMTRLFFRLYFRIHARGLENLPSSPFIVAPNHQSYLDGLLVVMFMKQRTLRNTYFYAKAKHVKRRWQRFIANRNNVIIMDIGNDLRQSLQKLASVLKKGRNVVIFPEGTRSPDGKLGQFKRSFVILSRELNVPIVPVAIRGADKALPRGKFFPRPWKRITIEFLHPVYPGELSYDALLETVRGRMAVRLEESGG